MRKFFLLSLSLVLVVVAQFMPSAVLVQTGELPLRVVAVTAQGITFFENTPAGTLEPLGVPFANFAVESYGGSAEWMSLASESFAVSPGGQRIAFTARRGSEAALFVYTINDGSLLQRPIVSYWLLPTWSPDSEAILLNLGGYFGGELPPPNAYVYELASDSLFQITFSAEPERELQWSADGSSLIYFGWCSPDPCGNPTRDLYIVSRDGADRFPLTDFPTQLPPNVDPFVCFLTWSPNDQRWYYVVGCGSNLDTHMVFAYSVDLNGNNRLEIDLEDYIRTTDGAGLTFQYGLIKGIHPRPEGIYFSAEVGIYPDIDLYPDAPDALVSEWRALRLTSPGQLETVYRQPLTSIGPVGLAGSVISPDGQRMVMLSGFGAFVIDIANNQNIGAVSAQPPPGGRAVCDVRWVNSDTIAYNVGANVCDMVTMTAPQAAHIMNVVTHEVTPLTDGLAGPAWVLPIPEVEVLTQIPLTANAGPNQMIDDTDGDGTEIVTLDGSGSIDGSNTTVSFEWIESGIPIPRKYKNWLVNR